jgi:hypothetical protein
MTTDGTVALALDQDGSCMVVNYRTALLERITGSSAATWLALSASTHGRPNAICRDGNTGDWIVGTIKDGSNGYLLRINRSTKSISTLRNLGPVYGVDWIPQTGEFVAARAVGSTQYLTWVSSTGSIRRSIKLPAPNCVTVCQKTGRVFTATSRGRVYGYTYAGASLGYRYYGVNRTFTGIDCYQDENVTTTTYTTSKTVRVHLRFWDSPGRQYFVALSLSPRNGIRLSTDNWINVRPDTLFFMTVGGGLHYFTSRFVGTLSSSGYGYAYFVMPYTGTPIYVTAVAVNPTKPDGLDVGNTAVVDSW